MTRGSDEELLTRALTKAADRFTPEKMRPLAEPPRGTRDRRSRWVTRVAPAAAAAGVVLIVVLGLVVSSGTRSANPARGVPAPAAAARAAGGPPKYYAEVEGKFFGKFGPDAARVVVRSTATGAVVARTTNQMTW